MKLDDSTGLRAASRFFAIATLAMTLLLLVFLAGQLREHVGSLAGGRIEPIAMLGADVLPAFFYLWALFALWATFRDISRGVTFEPAISRGLRQAGLALLGSGIASAFLVPLIKVPIILRGIANGTLKAGEHVVQLNAAYLMLMLVGIAMLLIARLFAMAAEVKARNQALEAELGEFL